MKTDRQPSPLPGSEYTRTPCSEWVNTVSVRESERPRAEPGHEKSAVFAAVRLGLAAALIACLLLLTDLRGKGARDGLPVVPDRPAVV